MQKAFPHSRIQQEGREALCRLLNEVPGISNIEVIQGNSNAFYDYAFQLHYLRGIKQKLYVEIKSRGERRFVEAFIQRIAGHAKPCECVLIAPYFSEQSCALLKERGYGFMDLSGNCHIAVESIYIHVSGQPNKYAHEKRNGKYFDRGSNAASKVLRTMLNDPVKVWQVKELTEESDTSLGTVSNIKRFLLDNAWAEEVKLSAARAAGFRLRNIEELIKAWAVEYRKRAGDIMEYYTLDSIPEFESSAARGREEHGGIVCLGGFSAAARYAPTVRYNRAEVYVDYQDLSEFLKDMELKAVSSGGNVLVRLATDDVEWMYTREIRGASVTSPIQTILDLMTHSGRGEEAAEAIIQKEFSTHDPR